MATGDGALLTMERAKQLITRQAADKALAQDDQTIGDIIAAAEVYCVRFVGPLKPVPTTVMVSGSYHELPNFIGPVTAVSTTAGVAWTDLAALSVEFGALRGLPAGTWNVTYTAGRAPLPADIANAVEEQFIHLWSQRRGNTRAADTTAHAAPWRVQEVLDAYCLPGFA